MSVASPVLERTEPPLVVDVDGTLIKTDLLHETALRYAARHPTRLFDLVRWTVQGKAVLKQRLADNVSLDIATLPLQEETVAAIRGAQNAGRKVYLASASDHRNVVKLAERVGGIAGVFASDGETNLAGAAKAERLDEAFGQGGYDYLGDRPVDFAIWRKARRQLVIAHSAGFERSVLARFPDAQVVARTRTSARDYLRAMRPHQWAKNVLLFLPLVTGHRFDLHSIVATLLGFVCFCAAASSAYIVNDLLDLSADRNHPNKHSRPFASGRVPILHGLLQSATLFLLAGTVSLLLPADFILILTVYVVATLAYSLVLKRKLFIDVIALGGLYTIRVFSGLLATGAAASEWLLMFCLFLFMSLATAKRVAELVLDRDRGNVRTVGRGYWVNDLPVMTSLGAAAGYGAVLVVALYISSSEVVRLYTYPERLWLIQPLLLYWISRILVLANRGELHEDPLIFALTDRVSVATGVCLAIIVGLAL